jgi:hypothetical protein
MLKKLTCIPQNHTHTTTTITTTTGVLAAAAAALVTVPRTSGLNNNTSSHHCPTLNLKNLVSVCTSRYSFFPWKSKGDDNIGPRTRGIKKECTVMTSETAIRNEHNVFRLSS